MHTPTAMLRSDLAEWELRQSRLTYRLLCHEARTTTICRFTSLTARQLSAYRHRWGFEEKDRSRGPSPSSFAPFFRTHRMRDEGAHLALLCKTSHLLPTELGERTLYTLTRGERLCDILELHKASYPQPSFSFDQLVLLVKGLTASISIRMGSCQGCGRTVLIDPLETFTPTCITCRQSAEQDPMASPEARCAL